MKSEIIAIAKRVYKEESSYYEDKTLQALCLEVSRKLRDELIKCGYNAQVVQGTFALDESISDDDGNEYYKPLHYWVEVEREILDITVIQFKDYLEYEDEIEVINTGKYKDNPRYKSIRKGWQ